jgi:hypothetical protein
MWEDMVIVQPKLERLFVEISTTRYLGGPSFCAEQLWAKRFKPRLAWLVGCYAHSDDPRMHTMAAYDRAFEKLYAALPPCRGCACVE